MTHTAAFGKTIGKDYISLVKEQDFIFSPRKNATTLSFVQDTLRVYCITEQPCCAPSLSHS